MWEVDVELVADWLAALDENSRAQVLAALEILQQVGPALGRPLVDSIRTSRHPNMKELRPGSAGKSKLRILFAFDPTRQAILLLAGNKAGSWNKWYTKNIPLADKLYDQHLARLKGETP